MMTLMTCHMTLPPSSSTVPCSTPSRPGDTGQEWRVSGERNMMCQTQAQVACCLAGVASCDITSYLMYSEIHIGKIFQTLHPNEHPSFLICFKQMDFEC